MKIYFSVFRRVGGFYQKALYDIGVPNNNNADRRGGKRYEDLDDERTDCEAD